MIKVLIDQLVHPAIEELFPKHWDLVYMTDGPSPADLEDVEAIFTYSHPTINGEVVSRMPKVKIVANFGVGVAHINVPEIMALGIPVTNTLGILHHTAAELTVGLLLAVTRRIVAGHNYAVGLEFSHYDPHLFLGDDLFGRTVGIVGMGQIGTEVARRLRHGFGMNVMYHNRKRVLGEVEYELGATYTDLDTLMSGVDVLVVLTTLTPETKNLVNAARIGMMKKGAYLINVGRGATVDQDALAEALKEFHLAGAGLDVTEPEPLPRDHALLRLPNVVITPHIGSATLATRIKMGRRTVENIEAVLSGAPPLDPVF